MQHHAPAQPAIDQATAQFFAAFDNRAGRRIDMTGLRALLLPEARIVRLDGRGGAEVMDVEGFIGPRQALLTDGALAEFHEWEERAETTHFGAAAVRRCTYRKSGLLNGAPYDGAGFKAISFARLGDRWRIAAVLWQDEADGLSVAGLAL